MQNPCSSCVALGALLALLLLGAPPAASAPEMAIIEVLGERPFAGRVSGIGLKRLEVIPAGQTEARELPLARVIEVRFPVPEGEPPAPPAHRVTLMGGSVLHGSLSSPDEESFQVGVAGAGSARISFDVLRSFEVLPSKAGPCTDLAATYRPADAGDIVYLQLGDDRISGTLTDADAKHVTFQDQRERTRRIEWGAIRVMHLENDPIEAKPGVRGEVELIDGSLFVTDRPPVLSGGNLRFALYSAPEAVFTVPLHRVHALRYTGGAFLYLTTLPYEGKHTPFYVPVHAPGESEVYPNLKQRWHGERIGRRPDGCPLRLGGKTYRHGFAVHSKSVLRFKLGGGYTSFQAVFGIDDRVLDDPDIGDASAANVDARVLGDGKPLWESKDVTVAGGPQKVGPIDVSGVRELELVVDFGQNLDTADRASWVNPILVRK